MSLLLAGVALSAAVGVIPDAPPPVQFAQLIIRQRVVVRVPSRAVAPVPALRNAWKEKKGPKCVEMDEVGGAAVIREDSVDLLLRGGVRLRAQFESSCPDLDYYSGFYIKPGSDGLICAGRDAIHARSGGECRVTRFRALVPVVADAGDGGPRR